jgi:hypothetical protein
MSSLDTILLLIIAILLFINLNRRDNFQDLSKLSNMQLLTVPIFRNEDLQVPTYVLPNETVVENFGTKVRRENFAEPNKPRRY